MLIAHSLFSGKYANCAQQAVPSVTRLETVPSQQICLAGLYGVFPQQTVFNLRCALTTPCHWGARFYNFSDPRMLKLVYLVYCCCINSIIHILMFIIMLSRLYVLHMHLACQTYTARDAMLSK